MTKSVFPVEDRTVFYGSIETTQEKKYFFALFYKTLRYFSKLFALFHKIYLHYFTKHRVNVL
jgi:hypothetical protein